MSTFLDAAYGKNKLSVRQIMSTPVLFLAFGFGSGLVKKMPGTMGTMAAIPVYFFFIQADLWLYSALTIFSVFAGFVICGRAAELLGEHDFGGIVWDEIAGFLVTMWLVPFSWQTVLVGFSLFRVFDIVKPWPIRWIDQKVEGGIGIMLDDVVAGIMAGIILYFVV